MNKNEIIFYLKVVCLFLYGMLTIITCAGVWNYNPEGFVKACAGLLFVTNGISIYCLAKKLKYPEDKKESTKETDKLAQKKQQK